MIFQLSGNNKPKTPPQISLLQLRLCHTLGNQLMNVRKFILHPQKESRSLRMKSSKLVIYWMILQSIFSESALATHISLRAYEETKDNRLVLAFIIGMAINKVNGDPNDPSDVPKSENSDPPESEDSLSLAA